MYDIAFIYSEIFKKHAMDRAHPESPQRLDEIMKAVTEIQEEKKHNITTLMPEVIDEELLLSVHVSDHLEKIRAISKAGGGMISIDTTLNEHTFFIAKYAAGATKQAAQLVDENKAKRSFAVVRPPGHHAESTSAGGFCYFNNVAVAAEWLIQYKGYNKVAIIDIDQHFGNGTSHIFNHRKDVLYVSIHGHPMYTYPGSGFPNEVGIVEGKGYNVNVALLPGAESIDWLHALKFSLNIVKQYQPEIILVSVGFDALGGDPVGIFNLGPNAFTAAGYLLNEIAKECCDGKISCTLEGGYKIDQLKEVSKKFILGLLGNEPHILRKLATTKPSNQTDSMLKQVRKFHKEFWKF
ncbi:MAG: histone deacetylase family protein [Candidatus Heimdallarchaeaceae archaeon]